MLKSDVKFECTNCKRKLTRVIEVMNPIIEQSIVFDKNYHYKGTDEATREITEYGNYYSYKCPFCEKELAKTLNEMQHYVEEHEVDS